RFLKASRLCTDRTTGAASAAAVDASHPHPPSQPASQAQCTGPLQDVIFDNSIAAGRYSQPASLRLDMNPTLLGSLMLSLSATTQRLNLPLAVSKARATTILAYNIFIHRSARLAFYRSSTCCSRQFRHYPTTTTTYELQDQHHRLLMGVHTFSPVQCQSVDLIILRHTTTNTQKLNPRSDAPSAAQTIHTTNYRQLTSASQAVCPPALKKLCPRLAFDSTSLAPYR
uniref:Secreted protein n=1 Tax=Mesocestoides corti TaxID=53468 RepID=A0A5K3FXL6_MESCO